MHTFLLDAPLYLFLPDISKWNTKNVEDMNFALTYCTSLTSLPDLSKWDISKVKFMASFFQSCLSLSYLPDISKWTNNGGKINISNIFRDCSFHFNLNDALKYYED